MGSTYKLLEGKERKNTSEGKKKRKGRAFARPSLELSPFMLSQLFNTVYQGKERKKHVGGKKEKKKLCVCPAESRTLALHAFSAFQYSTPTH